MTDVTIAALPVATSIADSDLIIVEEIGTPNVTKRGTAAQMRAPLLPIAGGTVTGPLTLNSTLTVVGATSTKSTATMSAGGGWGGSNYGKQLLITTPAGSSNPAIGITDGNGVNLWGIVNETGSLKLASMPAYSDGATAPTVLVALTASAVSLNKNTKITGTLETTSTLTVDAGGLTVTAGGLTVSADGATITGNSKITGTLETTSTLTVDAGGLVVTAGGLTVTASGADITGNSKVTGDLDVTGNLTAPNITGPTTVTGAATVASGVLTVTGTKLGTVTNAGQYDKSGVPVSPVTGGTTYSINATGDVLGSIFFATSDRRVKTSIREITADDAWQWICAALPVTFAMNGSMSAGFIAQDEIVNGRASAVSFVEDDRFAESDGIVPAGHRAIRNYEHDIAYLTAALQDVLGRLRNLEAR